MRLVKLVIIDEENIVHSFWDVDDLEMWMLGDTCRIEFPFLFSKFKEEHISTFDGELTKKEKRKIKRQSTSEDVRHDIKQYLLSQIRKLEQKIIELK